MVTSALLRFPSFDEISHTLEYLIRSPQVFINEVLVMQLEKPVIPFILFYRPMSFHDILHLSLIMIMFNILFLLSLIFILLSCQPNLTLLPKQRLKVITRDNLLIFVDLIIGLNGWVFYACEILELDLRFYYYVWCYQPFFIYFLHSSFFIYSWLWQIIFHYILIF